MRRVTFLILAFTFLALLNAYADKVGVVNVEDNKGGTYAVAELEEGGKFYHDRDYTITHIPEEFLGLTQIQVSANCPGGQDYRLTFEIDRPAFVYTAWDSRHTRPEARGQEPIDWFTNNYEDTEEVLFLDAPHAPTEYWIYKSNNAYPEGKVELLGIDEVIGDPVIMWAIFLEEYKGSAVSPSKKATITWAKVKASNL